MITDLQPIDAAHGGDGWSPRSSVTLREELGLYWAKCGIDSEIGRLRTVLLHRPDSELLEVLQPEESHWVANMDLNKAQQQHDNLAKIYEQHGVKVIYLEPGDSAKPNHMFARDLFAMTPEGAIICRTASTVRQGEEVAVSAALARHKIPILLTVCGRGIFEGPDLVFVNEITAFVAGGIRSNAEGISQVSAMLSLQKVNPILIQTTYGCGHLDGVMSILDRQTAILYPRRVSHIVFETLHRLDYEIILLPDSYEAETLMAINMVVVEPGLVIIPSGCTKTMELLKKHKIESIPVDVSELMHGGGAVHCLTGVIYRQSPWGSQ